MSCSDCSRTRSRASTALAASAPSPVVDIAPGTPGMTLSNDDMGRVRVFLRCRPPSDSLEKDEGLCVEVTEDGHMVSLISRAHAIYMCPLSLSHSFSLSVSQLRLRPEGLGAEEAREFMFDKCFSPAATQQDVFLSLADTFEPVMNGYNATIMGLQSHV